MWQLTNLPATDLERQMEAAQSPIQIKFSIILAVQTALTQVQNVFKAISN